MYFPGGQKVFSRYIPVFFVFPGGPKCILCAFSGWSPRYFRGISRVFVLYFPGGPQCIYVHFLGGPTCISEVSPGLFLYFPGGPKCMFEAFLG